MSIQHFVRCDVLLPNGQRCETRAEMKTQFDLPRGWRSVTQYERPTAAQGPFGGAFAPIAAIAKAQIVEEQDPEKREKVQAMADQMVDQIQAAAIEGMPNVAHQGHVCDRHELPKIELAQHAPGCLGY